MRTLVAWLVVQTTRRCAGPVVIVAALTCAHLARAEDIAEPAVFASAGGVLDVLMIAMPKAVPTIAYLPRGGGPTINPVAWVYEVCARPATGNTCPPGTATVSDYGGVRLALRAGDVLKIRLVNHLPPLDPAKLKHAAEPGQDNLFRNPTNLHTHGLIVPPRVPTLSDPTFGDYVFLEIYNAANGMPVFKTKHRHGLAKMDFADYRIDIPANHPSGAFWFHPHVHGLSLNQVSSGLAGIISIGDVKDYLAAAPGVVRHLILKDMQVLAAGNVQYGDHQAAVMDGEVQNQQAGDFCEERDGAGPDGRHGFCDGSPAEIVGGQSFVGSRWYFTINGQVFPTIHMVSPQGEIWRITNASAQLSYHLGLFDNDTGAPMAVQLVAIDGVSINIPPGTSASTLMTVGGNKFTVVDCPSGGAGALPICVRDLVMMPSARAEVWVAYRNSEGSVAAPPPNASATLKQEKIELGPAAEKWPQLKLARVEFAQPASAMSAVEVASHANIAVALAVPTPAARAAIMPAGTDCVPLSDGHHRRIFFGVENPNDANTKFGIGYEEVDRNGKVVKQLPVSAFDPDSTFICLPLGAGGSTVHETWEVVNLSAETHNFHIHQTKFRVLDATTQTSPSAPGPAIIEEDSVPVPFAVPDVPATQNGYCTIQQWHSSLCKSQSVLLDIPFSQLGDFVLHCHILEHEDGGMMARIRVVGARRQP
jgi:L-ascorbate oxidase